MEEVSLPDDESTTKALKLRYMKGEITKEEYDRMMFAFKSKPAVSSSSDTTMASSSPAPTTHEEQIAERPMAITAVAVLLILFAINAFIRGFYDYNGGVVKLDPMYLIYGAIAFALANGIFKGSKLTWQVTMTIATLLLAISIIGVVISSTQGFLLGIIGSLLAAIMMAIGIILLLRPEVKSFCRLKKLRKN